MKKIRLNENDIERLVNKIIKEERINEIDKKTWASAAEKAREQGMGKLGDKFVSHSREHGTTIVDNISFDVGRGSRTMVLKNFEIKSHAGDLSFKAENEEGKVYSFNVNERRGDIKTYLHGEELSWPSTVRDAKNYLSLLKDNGVDVSNIRPKQITSGYVNENKRRVKNIIKEGMGIISFYIYLSDVEGNFGKLNKVDPSDPDAHKILSSARLKSRFTEKELYGLKDDSGLLDQYVGMSSEEIDTKAMELITRKGTKF